MKYVGFTISEAAFNVIMAAEDYLPDNVGEIEVGVIKEFFATLPEKAFLLGVRILFAAIAFIIGMQVIKLLRKIVTKSMTRANADKGAVQFVDAFIKAALYILLAFMIAASFGVDAASIVAILASAGVAIGLALQGSLSNLAGGVLLLLLKPFKVGDYIVSESGHEGTVTELQLFYTKLITPDNRAIVLPNGTLSNGSLVNASAAEERRMDILVRISYQTDLKSAKAALQKIMEDDEAVRKDKEIQVFVNELGDYAVQMGVRCWFDKGDFWQGKCRILEKIKYTFDEAGIEIPAQQMDVYVKSSQ